MTNTVAVERFCNLLQTQAPAKPWQPVTDYSYEGRLPVEEPHAARIKQTFYPQLVLDYGCGFGHLVKLLRDLGVYAWGYEPNRPPRPELHRSTHVPFQDQQCDLVICREVLEHVELRHVAALVRDLCRLSAKYVYLTTRFHPNPDHLLDVATSDDLDPTHITLLNKDFLRLLFVLEGFVRDAEKEAAMDWQHKGRALVYRRV
jgi:SAM-dependent methyltransferase